MAEPVEAEIELERLKYRKKLMHVFETVLGRGMADGSMIAQNINYRQHVLWGRYLKRWYGLWLATTRYPTSGAWDMLVKYPNSVSGRWLSGNMLGS